MFGIDVYQGDIEENEIKHHLTYTSEQLSLLEKAFKKEVIAYEEKLLMEKDFYKQLDT